MTQRAAALAAINAVSNTSSIYASYMYPESAGPRYSKYLSNLGRIGSFANVNSRCYERQLCDGFHGPLHGHPAPIRAGEVKQEIRPR